MMENKLKAKEVQIRNLRAYFFISAKEPVNTAQMVDVEFAFDLDEASKRVSKRLVPGWYVRDAGYIPVPVFFSRIELSGTILDQKQKEEPKKRETTQQQFISNIKLFANEMASKVFKSKRDAESFKKLISKI